MAILEANENRLLFHPYWRFLFSTRQSFWWNGRQQRCTFLTFIVGSFVHHCDLLIDLYEIKNIYLCCKCFSIPKTVSHLCCMQTAPYITHKMRRESELTNIFVSLLYSHSQNWLEQNCQLLLYHQPVLIDNDSEMDDFAVCNAKINISRTVINFFC